MVMDDAIPPPPSLFLVLSYDLDAPYCISVLQLESPVKNNHESVAAPPHSIPLQVKRLLVDKQDYAAHFRVPPECLSIKWFFSPPSISTDVLYMVPDWASPYSQSSLYRLRITPPAQGYKFNFRTGECRPIRSPKATKYLGHVNGRGGHIYYMAHPDYYFDTPDPVFECYDPDERNWKALEPFPDHAVHRQRCAIKASAVLDDTILYNMDGWSFWAYNVPNDKWYIVNVEDDRCYNIVGEAVVLDNTNVYALTDPWFYPDLVLALSVEREEIDGDLVFKCSLRSEILVPGMDQIKYNKEARKMTRHLVHLGKDNFCLVQSCGLLNYLVVDRYQPIQLTIIKQMGENSMTVTNICLYELEIQDDKQFEVRLCFSLPECKTIALREGQRFLFNLDPCRQGPAAYKSKQEVQTDFNPEPEVEKPVQASTHEDCAEEGHSIYVKNLPRDATGIDLETELKKFGPIKWDGIRVKQVNTQGNSRFDAYVEFESPSSKRAAVEASSIMIKGCRAEIEEIRVFGFIVGRMFCYISERDYIETRGVLETFAFSL